MGALGNDTNERVREATVGRMSCDAVTAEASVDPIKELQMTLPSYPEFRHEDQAFVLTSPWMLAERSRVLGQGAPLWLRAVPGEGGSSEASAVSR